MDIWCAIVIVIAVAAAHVHKQRGPNFESIATIAPRGNIAVQSSFAFTRGADQICLSTASRWKIHTLFLTSLWVSRFWHVIPGMAW